MEPNRKLWNRGQQALRSALVHPGDHQKAIELFLAQHAMLHSASISCSKLWSFNDEVLDGLTDEAMRCLPQKSEHSIVWNIWHIARIEDITMNLLIAGSPQILLQESWLSRVKVKFRDTGNAMGRDDLANLSARIDIQALLAYRAAVGRRTREIVMRLEPGEVKQKVDPSRLQRIRDEGAVVDEAEWLIKYWGGLDKAGLLLMPPTRHNFVHLNESLRIRQKSRHLRREQAS